MGKTLRIIETLASFLERLVPNLSEKVTKFSQKLKSRNIHKDTPPGKKQEPNISPQLRELSPSTATIWLTNQHCLSLSFLLCLKTQKGSLNPCSWSQLCWWGIKWSWSHTKVRICVAPAPKSEIPQDQQTSSFHWRQGFIVHDVFSSGLLDAWEITLFCWKREWLRREFQHSSAVERCDCRHLDILLRTASGKDVAFDVHPSHRKDSRCTPIRIVPVCTSQLRKIHASQDFTKNSSDSGIESTKRKKPFRFHILSIAFSLPSFPSNFVWLHSDYFFISALRGFHSTPVELIFFVPKDWFHTASWRFLYACVMLIFCMSRVLSCTDGGEFGKMWMEQLILGSMSLRLFEFRQTCHQKSSIQF